MNLFPKKGSKKLTSTEKKKKERLIDQVGATPQNTINYTSNFESGLMHIVEHEYSKMYELGNLDYEVASEDDQLDIVVSYAEALNSLDKHSRYQLLVLNKRIQSSILDEILLPYEYDGFDKYRSEINTIISERFKRDQKNFEIKKYAVLSTEAADPKQATRQLNTLFQNYEKRFNETDVDLSMDELSGIERLKIMSDMLRPNKHFTSTYKDIALSGLSSKAFISPTRFKFYDEHFKMDDKFGKVLFIRNYPTHLEDRLIHELCKSGRELAISIHAKPYDMSKFKKDLRNKAMMNKKDIAQQQRKNFKEGLSEDMVSGLASEVQMTAEEIANELKDNGQKTFSGIFTVLLVEDSREQLQIATREIKDIAQTWHVEFDDVYKWQEEALNTVLPIGKPFLDVERNYMRDMTTSNVVTQIPFTNIELQSPTGQYYGQNQMSNNMITIDRKKDLITPSGLILGSSGSGKGMTVKWTMIFSLLKNMNKKSEKVIIVDPESEYLPIGKAFGAQILDISTGTENHFNLLDLPDRRFLDKEDQKVDLVKEKANLLVSLFESVLKDFSDLEASIVDRVTRMTYQAFEGQKRVATLVDWDRILKEQPEEAAKKLSVKIEPYTTGSQDIFAHETNIDLSAPFIIFNIKHLDEQMKGFAMKVILDQIWKQVVMNQGKLTTNLYFDELQLNFDTEENASWFMKLWSRVRKYGAIPTGITQNISTLLETSHGQKMISNSEFIVLLRQKLVDMEHLKRVIKLPPNLTKYIGEKVPKGTGLISAGGVVVPFENPIPKETELFELMNTDAN
ncbi:VirB4-like conjugal transfer ATPase, CD1110 family [Enterococcus sp. AZ012]|uniref:VirB4-like conjugal transfer ATPase, CD1110 family n=1 Tax=unclassified Enterococcus TaxID=2608891 RepID=UPI003D294447